MYIAREQPSGAFEFVEYTGQALEQGDALMTVPSEDENIKWTNLKKDIDAGCATVDANNWKNVEVALRLYEYHKDAEDEIFEKSMNAMLREHLDSQVLSSTSYAANFSAMATDSFDMGGSAMSRRHEPAGYPEFSTESAPSHHVIQTNEAASILASMKNANQNPFGGYDADVYNAASILVGMKGDLQQNSGLSNEFTMDVDSEESNPIDHAKEEASATEVYDLSGATLVGDTDEQDDSPNTTTVNRILGKDVDLITESLASSLLGNQAQAQAYLMDVLRERFDRTMTVQGPDPQLVCWMCLHPGHDQPIDPQVCPVARLQTYIYHDFTEKLIVGTGVAEFDVVDFFFADVRTLRESLDWAKSLRGIEGAAEFGVKNATVGSLETLLQRCKFLSDNGWIGTEEGIPEELFADDAFVSIPYHFSFFSSFFLISRNN